MTSLAAVLGGTCTGAIPTAQVDQWLDISQSLVPGAGFESVAASVNQYLSLRTFLAGYALSLADVACWAQLQLTLQWDRLKKTGSFGHLERWWAALLLLCCCAAVML